MSDPEVKYFYAKNKYAYIRSKPLSKKEKERIERSIMNFYVRKMISDMFNREIKK